jgi:hypothetical protein
MVQSTSPRAGLPAPTEADDADHLHGREWATNGRDLQSACTFALPSPIACDQENRPVCLCYPGVVGPPVCSGSTTQSRARAVPSIRHLRVAKGLMDRAIVGAVCPTQTADATREDFGYWPTLLQLEARVGQRLR